MTRDGGRTLRVGVIGAGIMGAAHVRTLHEAVPRLDVTEVFDMDLARAQSVADGAGASVSASAEALIASADVDAIVVASPDSTHADLVIACLDAGKPVLCEKPLALTPVESLRVVEAEIATGRRSVQVGFMRRYDPSYTALREAVRDGRLGQPRLVHHVHRNPSNHTSTTDSNLITGSMIHELDVIRWLLDDEVESIQVTSPVREGFRDPQLATIRMTAGTLVSAEVFVNARYGYDVRCEVVGSEATAALVAPALVSTREAGTEGVPVRSDFVFRFAEAYAQQMRAWAHDVVAGTLNGPSAWDGHVANIIAEAGVAALTSGATEPVAQLETPSLYLPSAS